MADRHSVIFYLNGRRVEVQNPDPQMTLLEYLRREQHLTGTKYGCGEGGCGACTVNMTRREQRAASAPEEVQLAINACLAPLCSVDGTHITTIEGIGNASKPHPAQERIAKLYGSQCGFCTPGIVMSLYTELQKNAKPTLHDIEDAFDGNLCRCTGYRPILDAAKTFSCDPSKCPKAAERAKLQAELGPKMVLTTTASKIEDPLEFERCDSTSVPAHAPPTVAPELNGSSTQSLSVLSDASAPFKASWLRPTSLAEMCRLKKNNPGAKVITGNTEVGIEMKLLGKDYATLISTSNQSITSLHRIETNMTNGETRVGGAVTLTQVMEHAKAVIPKLPKHATGNLAAIVEMLQWFASTHIRNVASLAGNVMNASPISDMNPILLAADASLVLSKLAEDGKNVTERTLKIRNSFFTGYRRTVAEDSEVLSTIIIPGTRQDEVVKCYKQARRRDDDISIACACIRVLVDKSKKQIAEAFTGVGGMAITTVAASAIEAALKGTSLPATDEDSVLAKLETAVAEDFKLAPDVPGGMPAFRQSLVASFAFKFLAEVNKATTGQSFSSQRYESMVRSKEEDRQVSHGAQAWYYDQNGGGVHHSHAKRTVDGDSCQHEESLEKHRGAVGEPVAHRSAMQQCTGEAKYIDDIPDPSPQTLHAAFVLSDRPTGTFTLDTTEALAMPGVEAVFGGADIGAKRNVIGGAAALDEQILRENSVTSFGQAIAVVVAKTPDLAARAVRKVKVNYAADSATEPIISIDQAIAKNSFLNPDGHEIVDGDPDGAFAGCDAVVSGKVRIGGQEHFYLETNAAVAIPGEDDEMHVYASTQACNMTQRFVAQACGAPANKVVAHVKRMGGGFGGKETRTVFMSAAVAFAAHRLKVPVRFTLSRQDDMVMTGTRHPFQAEYKIGGKKDGSIVALDLKIYNNAGYSFDLSEPVLDRAIFHCENAYKIPNIRVVGKCCKTNTVTNTAFRGFGAPQGMMIAEQYVEHIAKALGVPAAVVRERNLYRQGFRTHFGQQIECNLERLWSNMHSPQYGDIARRQAEVEVFNKANRWRKRGLAVLPTKFGISFTATFMNQAGALVNIYTDGTVLVTHGGTEMGQGLHTKMIQIAARALNVDVSRVHIAETASDKVPNASPTAASASSDLYGMAVLDACEQLNARLEPFYNKICPDLPVSQRDSKFQEVVFAGYFARVNLSAQGFYKTPVTGYDFTMKLPQGACNSARGMPFMYFTQGISAAETEIDVLTGDMRVIRADVIMDLGNSLNPTIDIGQIEGAFVQGLGWCMMEECVWGGSEHRWVKPGGCFTRGPGNYKIPSFNDVPVDFRVSLLGNAPNKTAIHSSKAVGEPPLFTAACAFFATRNAIANARSECGLNDYFSVDSPLTPERIRLACGDRIAKKYVDSVVSQGGAEQPALFC